MTLPDAHDLPLPQPPLHERNDEVAAPVATPTPASLDEETVSLNGGRRAQSGSDAPVLTDEPGVEESPEPALPSADMEALPGELGLQDDTRGGATMEPATGDALTEMRDALTRIEDELAESHRLIGRQAEIAGRLHAENQVLRAGELRKAQGALVMSVLRVYDDVSRMADTAAESSTARDLALVAETLTDALARNGVDRIVVEAGEPFTPSRHKISAVEPVTDESAQRTVLRVLRPGFSWVDGDVVRVADVVVGKYTAAPLGDEDPRAAAAAFPPSLDFGPASAGSSQQ